VVKASGFAVADKGGVAKMRLQLRLRVRVRVRVRVRMLLKGYDPQALSARSLAAVSTCGAARRSSWISSYSPRRWS
jgi:hypothetical protein